jgi:hypothetical protein
MAERPPVDQEQSPPPPEYPQHQEAAEPERPLTQPGVEKTPYSEEEQVPQPVFSGGPQYTPDEQDAGMTQSGKVDHREMPMQSELPSAPASVEEEKPEVDQSAEPAYRPFPGNEPEDEERPQHSVHDIPAVQRHLQQDEDSEVDQVGARRKGTPSMAPSLRADKPKRKKRSFFKRLFGLK